MKLTARLNLFLSKTPIASAVSLMILASGFLTSQHGLVRYLASDLHPIEIVFFRNLFGLIIFIPWLVGSGLNALRTSRFGTHALRATFNAGSLMAYFMALSLIPLANATALFLSVPLFVTIGAIVFLGERVGPARWLALAAGAAGAVIVLRPGIVEISVGSLLVLVGAVFSAGTRLLAKSLSRTDGSAAIVAYVTIFLTPVTLLAATFVWRWPSLTELPFLIAIGALGSLGQLSFVKAYSLVNVSFAEPMVFTRLLWAALIGYLLLAEIPDVWTLVGGAIIVAATTYIAYSKNR